MAFHFHLLDMFRCCFSASKPTSYVLTQLNGVLFATVLTSHCASSHCKKNDQAHQQRRDQIKIKNKGSQFKIQCTHYLINNDLSTTTTLLIINSCNINVMHLLFRFYQADEALHQPNFLLASSWNFLLVKGDSNKVKDCHTWGKFVLEIFSRRSRTIFIYLWFSQTSSDSTPCVFLGFGKH